MATFIRLNLFKPATFLPRCVKLAIDIFRNRKPDYIGGSFRRVFDLTVLDWELMELTSKDMVGLLPQAHLGMVGLPPCWVYPRHSQAAEYELTHGMPVRMAGPPFLRRSVIVGPHLTVKNVTVLECSCGKKE